VFVHRSAIEMDGFRTLKPEDPVTFESTTGTHGCLATRVNSIPVMQDA
jgi:cold shock CspA family protein